MRKEILYAENLTTDQTSEQNIDHVSFLLEQGEILGVTGLHGSGISALAAALCGERRISHGTIYLDGEPVRLASREQANHLGIYQITQSFAVVPTLSVSENLNILRGFSWRGFLIDQKLNQETTRVVFEHYGISGNPNGYPGALSKGEQAQLSICRAMICGAKVLVCREIGEGFSEDELLALHRFLRQLCGEGISVVLITPDARKALRFSDHVAVMRGGMICYYREAAEATLEEMVRCMAVKTAASVLKREGCADRHPISFRGVRLREFGARSITAELYGGVSLGLFWAFSSYGDLVTQLFTGRKKGFGTVLEGGVSCSFNDWLKRNRQQIFCLGIRFWECNLNENMTVAENLLLRTYYRYNDRLGILNRPMLGLALREFAAAHGIDPACFEKYPRHLSPELRNQIVLWSVLFSPPKLLVLDCPMYTMDEQIRRSFLNALAELKAGGTAILWSDSSESPQYYCDRFITI